MLSPHAALAAALTLLAAPVVAQNAPGAGNPPASPAKPTTPPPAASPGGSTAPSTPSLTPAPAAPAPGAELDPATRELVRREVERAKEEMRDEIRAEIQGQQSAREFMQSTGPAERTKLEFFQVDGYMRVRGDLFDNLDLRRDSDLSGRWLFPRPLIDPQHHGTLTTSNMRLRLEPTLNVSEQVRVRSQFDVLDDLILGQTPIGLFNRDSTVVFPAFANTQPPPELGVNSTRSSIVAKRAWAEVQTPVGLLSFGRMPSSWGMGILSHAGGGIDDDLGDSVDRIQFALPLKTPVGELVLVPMYEIVASGVSSVTVNNSSVGQPFDVDQLDDAKAIGIKVVHEETAAEAKRHFDRNEASSSFGAWYMYKSQSYEFPAYVNASGIPTGNTQTASPGTSIPTSAPAGNAVHRDAYAHVLDFWFRRETKRFKLEAEAVGVYGQIGNASESQNLDPSSTIGPVLLRQFGGVIDGTWHLFDGKLHVGGEAGIASGDTNPGLGNQPGRGPATCNGSDPISGGGLCDVEGQQFRPGDKVLDIRNFRFNPAYRIDLVLWREILQGVTDAWYLKPHIRYDLLEGLAAQAAVVYSQAIYGESTPSGVARPLGVELDLGLSYQSEDGFVAWLNYGLLQPLRGMEYSNNTGHPSLSRGHALRTGLGVKF